MILIIHIILSLTSIIQATYVIFSPTKAKQFYLFNQRSVCTAFRWNTRDNGKLGFSI